MQSFEIKAEVTDGDGDTLTVSGGNDDEAHAYVRASSASGHVVMVALNESQLSIIEDTLAALRYARDV